METFTVPNLAVETSLNYKNEKHPDFSEFDKMKGDGKMVVQIKRWPKTQSISEEDKKTIEREKISTIENRFNRVSVVEL